MTFVERSKESWPLPLSQNHLIDSIPPQSTNVASTGSTTIPNLANGKWSPLPITTRTPSRRRLRTRIPIAQRRENCRPRTPTMTTEATDVTNAVPDEIAEGTPELHAVSGNHTPA